MSTNNNIAGLRSLRWLPLAAAVMSLAIPVRAAAVLTMTVGSVTVDAGSTGDALDVTLANTGTSAVTLGGFAFEFTVTNPGISFTAVNTNTTLSYIFNGHSEFGPDISNPPPNLPGLAVAAEDIYAIPFMGTTLMAGGTLGLGHVLFNVSSTTAPGMITVALLGSPVTNLSDAAGNPVAVNALSNGTITVRPSGAVPEPSSLLIGGTAVGYLIVVRGLGGMILNIYIYINKSISRLFAKSVQQAL